MQQSSFEQTRVHLGIKNCKPPVKVKFPCSNGRFQFFRPSAAPLPAGSTLFLTTRPCTFPFPPVRVISPGIARVIRSENSRPLIIPSAFPGFNPRFTEKFERDGFLINSLMNLLANSTDDRACLFFVNREKENNNGLEAFPERGEFV